MCERWITSLWLVQTQCRLQSVDFSNPWGFGPFFISINLFDPTLSLVRLIRFIGYLDPLGQFGALCEGGPVHMGGCLHKNNTSFLRTRHCVIEQTPLLVVTTSNRRWPQNNDVVELSVLGSMNCHPFPSTHLVSARLAALGKGLLNRLHDLIL